eukprot:SAG11_NODE_24202_length_376_cov_6.462094_1_plen_76_part_10
MFSLEGTINNLLLHFEAHTTVRCCGELELSGDLLSLELWSLQKPKSSFEAHHMRCRGRRGAMRALADFSKSSFEAH